MDPGTRSTLWYLLVGTRGGPNRLRVLQELRNGPANAHRLALGLSIDYRTLRHHLRILEQNRLIVRPMGPAYASPYELPPHLVVEFEQILQVVEGKGLRRRAGGRPSPRPGGAAGL